MSPSISCLYINTADCSLVQQTSADQLTSYCLTFTVSRHLPTMAKYITHLDVSLNPTEEQSLLSHGYKKINVDLNKRAGGNNIYLWYKNGSAPITRLQVTFNDEMAVGLINAGYTKIPKDLNAGERGDVMYLWYFRGHTEYDIPIVGIDVTTTAENEAAKFGHGWERMACDLNRRAGGDWIHAWVKREKQAYICDVTATDSYGSDVDNFQAGYIRVDEDTNRGAGGAYVFIWYRQTTDSKRALTDVQVSTNGDSSGLQNQYYTPVSVNLNQRTSGNLVYLWYKQDKVDPPIKAITLLLNQAAMQPYEKAGIKIIERNLNTGNGGVIEYLCVNQ